MKSPEAEQREGWPDNQQTAERGLICKVTCKLSSIFHLAFVSKALKMSKTLLLHMSRTASVVQRAVVHLRPNPDWDPQTSHSPAYIP